MLASSVDVIALWKSSNELNKLVLVNENSPCGRKKGVSGGFAKDLERERRIIAPDELKVTVIYGIASARLWKFDQGIRQVVLSGIRGGDILGLDVDTKSSVVLVVNGQDEFVDVDAVDIALMMVSKYAPV